MWKRDLLFLGLVVGGGLALAASLMPPREPRPKSRHDASTYESTDFQASTARADEAFASIWAAQRLTPAPPADDLTVARRLALGLMGSIPSLEEVRQLESLPPGQRLAWWLDHLLDDPRCHEYLAERFARAFVGTEDGPFVFYRRRRFAIWLAEQLRTNRPYDALAREVIASKGLWTNEPATNYVTVTSRPDRENQPDPVRLAGRTMKAFLGIRLDCVECHDKPDHLPGPRWKQADFHRLAAYFGRTRLGFTGIYDAPSGEYAADLKRRNEPTDIEPGVPYSPELLGQGSRREQLAAWVTDPRNPYFAQALVNRMWALLAGLPLVSPVDSLDGETSPHPALEAFADDFRRHGHDLRRLIRVMAWTRAYRADSAADPEPTEADVAGWAVFPLTRLRPEQVAGSVIQASSVTTIDHSSNILVRLVRFGNLNEFLRRYGDTGEDELEGRGGTIPQRLLLMNGELVRERIKPEGMTAAQRIADTLADDARAVEAAYLTVLTRRPTEDETHEFVAMLKKPGLSRQQRMTDLFWALINSTEMSWNH
jgi:hypothetical protein